MWRRYLHQAKLVTLLVNFLLLHQLVIGKKFKITFDLTAIDPCKWIKPLKDQQQLGDHDINSMLLTDMIFFMQQYLVIRFPLIFFRVDKNIIAKRTRRFITAYFYYSIRSIDNDRVAISPPKQQCQLKYKTCSKHDHSKPIDPE